MNFSFVVTDNTGAKHEIKAKSYLLAAKTIANEILKENEQSDILVKGMKIEKKI